MQVAEDLSAVQFGVRAEAVDDGAGLGLLRVGGAERSERMGRRVGLQERGLRAAGAGTVGKRESEIEWLTSQ